MQLQIPKTELLASLLQISCGITCIVGGGGKTSLMLHLAQTLQHHGTVIVTTTTHIWPPEGMMVLQEPTTKEAVQLGLRQQHMLCVGMRCADGKLAMSAIQPEVLASLADYVLIEADGAKRLPLKAPDAHEPVIPDCTKLVIAVAGLDGVGKSIAETAFRAEQYAKLIGIENLAHCIAPADVASVLMNNNGQRKFVTNQMRYAIVLNKADDAQRIETARQIAALIEPNVAYTVVATCLKEKYKC
ncbi:MAG: selenium cofactor biosynthesis protein YqeC [Clostridia bacterium]